MIGDTSDLQERLLQLEKMLGKPATAVGGEPKIDVRSLPLADLIRALEGNWSLRASDIVEAESIQEEQIKKAVWVAPVFAATWSNFVGPFALAQYRRDVTGAVCLRGTVKKSSAPGVNDVIFTLPVEYRPKAQHVFSSGLGPARIDVDTSGNVMWVSGTGTDASLDQVRFYTD